MVLGTISFILFILSGVLFRSGENIVLGVIALAAAFVCSVLGAGLRPMKTKTTRAKVLKKNVLANAMPTRSPGELVTFLFPGNKKRTLRVWHSHYYSIDVGDIVEVKHQGRFAQSVKNVIVSTTRATVIKKHPISSMAAGISPYKLTSFLFPDTKTHVMVVPKKYAKLINAGDAVTLTHRGGYVESLKKEANEQQSAPAKTQIKSIPRKK